MTRIWQRRTFGFAVLLWLLTAGAAWAQTGNVTFCSYNLRNWLLQRSFSDSPATPPRAKPEREKEHVIQFLLQIHPDILGVCEIGDSDDLKELQTRLKAAGVDLPNVEMSQGHDPSRSLALLSRFPIVARHSETDLRYQMGRSTFAMQRGILDVSVAVSPAFELRCVGAHLKSKREVQEADESLMRRNEAHLLRRHLDDILNTAPRTSIVCYGDFNENRNQPAINEIIGSRASDAYMTDVFLRDDHGLVWTHFWDAADVYSRFDYFFVSRELRPHVDARRSRIFSAPDFYQGSDHRPIVLSLKNVD